jgi:hypothetical protein
MSDITAPKLKTLPIGHLIHQAEFARAYWHLTVPNDITLADLLRPAFWQHYPNTLRAPALIDVMSEDQELDVQLRVLGTDVGMVFVRLRAAFNVRDGEEETGEPAEVELPDVPDGYRVGFTPARGYYAQLSMDGGQKEIVSQDNETKLDAINGAIDHARRSGRITEKAA